MLGAVDSAAVPALHRGRRGLGWVPVLGHNLDAASIGAEEEGRALIYCAVCGDFAESRAKALRRSCAGKSAPGLALQRSLLERRLYPQCNGERVHLGPPRALSEDQRLFANELLGTEAQGGGEEAPAPSWNANGRGH